MTRQENLEVYIRDGSEQDILGWLSGVLGPLREVESLPLILHTDHAGERVAVVIQPEVGDGTYASVYIAPNVTPWETDADMARAASRALGREVRCDPGALSRTPWHWLRVHEGGEELVDWDEDPWDPHALLDRADGCRQLLGMTDLFPPDALAPAPIETALTIPSAWYTDPRMLAFERDAVFARTWQFVGHASRLRQPGEFLTATVADNPVVVVRDRDGDLRAFYNVCRHRGGPLATDDHGCARMLQCAYHGWTYRLDGSLRGVPRFGHSELFDKRDFGLTPVEVATYAGLVFVRLEPGGPALAEALGGIEARIAPLDLSALAFHTRVEYRVACDWKVYVDNYLEGYHLPLVHPELCDVLDARAYRTETFAHYNLQHSPLREGEANVYGGSEDAAFYYWLFPNTMLNVLPGRLQTNTVLPDGPRTCRVLFDYHYADADRQRVEDDLAFSDRVQAEDIVICEHVQRGLASRGYDRGVFSPAQEVGVHHFQELLKASFCDETIVSAEGR